MSRVSQIPLDFADWIIRSLDGSITTEQFSQFEQEIIANREARSYYLEFITTYIGLMDLVGALPEPTSVIDKNKQFDKELTPELLGKLKDDANYIYPLQLAPDISEEDRKRKIEASARQQLEVFLKEQHKDITRHESPGTSWSPLWALDKLAKTATVIFNVGLKVIKIASLCSLATLLFILIYSHFFLTTIPKEIATLSTSLNATLSDNETIESGMRLTNRKDSLFLRAGLIEILFDDGAKVLLEAPAAFRLKSSNQMVLHQGQLFAYVPDFAQGFTVITPNSQVIDMGTEFGIRVELNGTSDLYMFKGKAALALDSISDTRQTLALIAGQAKRINTSGQVKDIPIKEDAFVRHFDSDTEFVWRGQKLCLADIVGHGNGLGTGHNNVFVDPIEGYVETLYCSGKGNQYHILAANPFIDGLFIPDGRTQQVVSSQGHVFSDCPETNGECHANLSVTPKPGIWAWPWNSRTGIVRFNGQIYGDPSNPFLMMHANLGVTFDLNAIRALSPDIRITHFIAQTGIADFEEPAPCNADFWVLVDGQVCASRRHVTFKGVLSDMSVELTPSDRFLTLITTDGGDIDQLGDYRRSYRCDWCVFAQPSLLLNIGEGPSKNITGE